MAAAPTRSTGTLTIGFGLVTVPVKVFSGLEDSGVKRNRFTADGHEVGMKNYDKETGEDVAYADIVTKYRTADGTLVDLTDDEIANIAGDGNGTARVIATVPNSEFSKYHAESLLQVRPDYGKSKKAIPAIDKAFALFVKGLEAADKFALIEFTLRGKPRLGALTADGFLRVVAYNDEVREARPLPEAELSDAELAMAVTLIDTMAADTFVAVDDEVSDKVRAYAETKATGAAPVEAKATLAPAGDLLAQLQASIAAASNAA